jgi:hypothetical protein
MRSVGFQFFGKQLQIELNRRQRIADFVSQSAGEHAEFGESFGLPGALLKGKKAAIEPDPGNSEDNARDDQSDDKSGNEPTHENETMGKALKVQN